MTERLVSYAPHGTVAGYERGCRCTRCRPAGEHIAADGTPEPPTTSLTLASIRPAMPNRRAIA